VPVSIQGLASKFLLTMKDYPPSRTPGAFNLRRIEERLRNSAGSSWP
jgi:arylsulfatase